jgi:small GTP-binding protein
MKQSELKRIKITLMGDEGVGKTQIVNRLARDNFSEEYKASTGWDVSKKQINNGGMRVLVSLWDIASASLDSAMLATYLYTSQVILVVYDCTNKDTF